MFRHPVEAVTMTVLFYLVGLIFFILLIGLILDRLGWLEGNSQTPIILLVVTAMLMTSLTSYMPTAARVPALLIYLILSLCLLHFPSVLRIEFLPGKEEQLVKHE